ncbi:AKT-interacting protein [Lampetra fluviatilis]
MASGFSGKRAGEGDERRGSANAGDSGGQASRVGPGKKQLPPIPRQQPSASTPKPLSPPTAPANASNGTHAAYGPYFLEYSLLSEFALLVRQKLPGVYVQPSCKSALTWFGVIFIRQGLYQDGVFKFTVYIPDNYPDGDCPRLVFDWPVFHPVINETTGELDVKRAFNKWRRNQNHIWQVMLYARQVFYKIETSNPLSTEAALLYEKDIQQFRSKVMDSVKLCNSHIFDPPKIEDAYAIRFSPWNPQLHEGAREKMLSPKKPEEPHSRNAGLSWVKPGTTQPFSKDESPF